MCKQIVINVECKQNGLNIIRKVLKFGTYAPIKNLRAKHALQKYVRQVDVVE